MADPITIVALSSSGYSVGDIITSQDLNKAFKIREIVNLNKYEEAVQSNKQTLNATDWEILSSDRCDHAIYELTKLDYTSLVLCTPAPTPAPTGAPTGAQRGYAMALPGA